MQGGDGGLPQAGSKPGGYVPPSKRGGASEGDSMRRREENSVRVTNLSEDTREDDLRVCHQIMSRYGSSACTQAGVSLPLQMNSRRASDVPAAEACIVHIPACL